MTSEIETKRKKLKLTEEDKRYAITNYGEFSDLLLRFTGCYNCSAVSWNNVVIPMLKEVKKEARKEFLDKLCFIFQKWDNDARYLEKDLIKDLKELKQSLSDKGEKTA